MMSHRRKPIWIIGLVVGLSLVLGWMSLALNMAAAQGESTPTASDTLAPTVASTDTETPVPTPSGPSAVFLPLVLRQPPPPETLLYCSQPGRSIPDNDPHGIEVMMLLDDPRRVLDVNVYVNIDHTWLSDLTVTLDHAGSSATLVDRPGMPALQYGCSLDDMVAILDDQAERPVEDKCGAISPSSYAPAMPAIGGSYRPNEALGRFSGQEASGEWMLKVADHYVNDRGVLNAWCLELTLSSLVPVPTPTPPPPDLPDEAFIPGLTGEDQQYNLDCETRSAVDWAHYFGVPATEDGFFNRLPSSLNPELGFVGDKDGPWGLIPPQDYGVHAAPIAAVLQQYGLQAAAVRPLSWDDLRAQIAAGHPVIVWVIGPVASSYPVFYTPAEGPRTVVAPYEHTVIVAGYDPDSVWVLDGAPPYDHYPLDRFLDSWGVLRYMAVVMP